MFTRSSLSSLRRLSQHRQKAYRDRIALMSRRRDEARTDETTLSEGLRLNVALEGIAKSADAAGLTIDELILMAKHDNQRHPEDRLFTKSNLEGAATPLEVLRRTLSVRSVLSTTSSFAERMEDLRTADLRTLKLTEIGRGSFGMVYEIPGTEWCLKKTLTSPRTTWVEFTNGKLISERVNNRATKTIISSEKFPDALMARVPRYLCSYGMSNSENPEGWFKMNGHRFPVENGGQKPGPVICLERIMPLPKPFRENLIRHYFKPEKREAALVDKRNKACLCRAYLGCVSNDVAIDKLEKERATLQDFPLYLDMLRELDMKPFTIARDMALGLAAGHWSANVDMLDVEFVIGSRPFQREPEIAPVSRADKKAAAEKSGARVRNMCPYPGPGQNRPSFRNRAIQLWMIDFNKAEKFNASVDNDYNKTIRQLVFNTRSTDGPYYPRVLDKNEYEWNLWIEFANTYIAASKVILNELKEDAETVGLSPTAEQAGQVMKRPGRVINEWMRAEAMESNVTSLQFSKKIKNNGWRVPRE
ncbi:hypothetical protein S40285_10509 [Stachybotrys chlorohalonatus IBT 40285]|uniref:DUF3669 domain-containing protein n=1 Tax=Stachybotrys chlorohalonatus (strain IBT 40285) TaxID=1283841 RepID=A0A084QGI4_STAC4|nr:hypothetical protein S40285_10509 [Stachybotrys chlorohalonata IBT 40285]